MDQQLPRATPDLAKAVVGVALQREEVAVAGKHFRVRWQVEPPWLRSLCGFDPRQFPLLRRALAFLSV